MIILEMLGIIFTLIILLVVKLMPIWSVFLIGFCIVALFSCIYYSRLPNLKMRDEEIPVEQITFKRRNLIKELHEERG